jgi:hypothetical protein
MSRSVETATIECVHCHASVDESTALRLFDGRWYCRMCVERESPALAEYAAENDHLDDQITYDVKALLLKGAMLALLWALMIPFIPFAVHLSSFAEYLVAGLSSALFAGLIFGVGLLEAQLRYPRTMVIEAGQVSIYSPMRTRRYQLQNCQWRLQRSGLRQVLTEGITPRARLLAIYVPGWRRRKPLAACQNDRSRELWTHFLKLSGVPEHR